MRPGVTDKRPRPICTILIEERRSTMNDVTNVALAESWRRLWNGDLGQLDAIVADTFVAHAAMLGGTGEDTLRGRAALGQWIERMHAVMTGLTFGIEVGPITNADYLVVRWRARATYRGGLPGASAAAIGREVNFTGIDILRAADGRIAEYWVNSDTLLLVQQLGVEAMSVATE